jgi:hypothetical protein
MVKPTNAPSCRRRIVVAMTGHIRCVILTSLRSTPMVDPADTVQVGSSTCHDNSARNVMRDP